MQHLAIIPDGNRRWAKKNKLESMLGHHRGFEAVHLAINVCIKHHIKYLSLYTFSLENFRRDENEKSYFFNLLREGFKKHLPTLVQKGVRIRMIGDRNYLPTQEHEIVTQMEEQTRHLSTLNLNLLFCYGATAEIAQAARVLAQKVKDGVLGVHEIDEKAVHKALWTGDMPDPDLIIRTSGVVRLSNFLLFQAAYAEFAFLDCYWPEVTEEILEQCLEKFKATQRNFGH